MRSSISIVLALSAIATVTEAKFGSTLKSYFHKLSHLNRADGLQESSEAFNSGWPQVNWPPLNYFMTGKFYTLNNETSKIESYLNMTDEIYFNGEANREKAFTNLTVENLGDIQITTYIDATHHKIY